MNPSALLRAMRPQQWVKNVFVLVALVFAAGESGLALAKHEVVPTLLACLAFCFISSAVYLLNDIVDVEKDRAHPKKCKRPIASGELSVSMAILGAVVLAASSMAIAWGSTGNASVMLVLVVYGSLNVAYSFKLKHVVLVDVFCIAAGFLLRVEAGGRAAEVEISHWAYLCMLFLALFLGLNKRRAEMQQMGIGEVQTRASLGGYSLGFLDQMVGVMASCTILTYTMYTVDPDTIHKFGSGNYLVWTVPYVVFGVGRYMLLVQSKRGGSSPTKVLLGGDLWFLINILAYLGTLVFAVFATA